MPMLRRCGQLTLAIMLLASGAAVAQTGQGDESGPRCDGPGWRQFDFWLGDWSIQQRIRTADGGWVELPAQTRVRRALGGCALLERWRGKVQFFWGGMTHPAAMRGMSVRSYDPKSGDWTIWWMDTMNPGFGSGFTGRFQDDKGEFFSEHATPDGGKRLARITFSDIQPDSVHWDLATSHDDGATWNVIWAMEMRREKATGAENAPQGVRRYYLGLIYRGEKSTPGSSESTEALQRAHMANIRRLAQRGDLVLAGPSLDDGDLRGIFIYDAPSLEAARELAESDPAVQAGRLRVELHPWWGPLSLRDVVESNPE
jgi:uncharacterized protein YciI